MNEIIDITMPLHAGMLLYPGTPPFEWREYRKIADGDSSNNSMITMGSHVGTHVDAPAHYVEGGSRLGSVSLDILVGPCRVYCLQSKEINASILRSLDLGGVARVLFRTPSSDDLSRPEFKTDFAHVTSDGADVLLEHGVRLVGVDYLTLDKYKSPEHPAHNKLLGAGVVVVEGLDMSLASPGDYELICCPLRIPEAEAAPARVLLRRV